MNFSYIDDPMCPGKVATYSCIAGGINAFKVSHLSLQQVCSNGKAYLGELVSVKEMRLKEREREREKEEGGRERETECIKIFDII
jgi:hypothetical protein